MTRRQMFRNAALAAGGAASAILLDGSAAIADTDTSAEQEKTKGSEKEKPLKCYPVHHAGRKRITHPELNREILSQTAVCYLRFLRKVRLSHLKLPVVNEPKYSGRWVPNVPTHPAHIIVSSFDNEKNCWETIKSVDLAPNPKFAGEGLSQAMSMEDVEDFFKKAVDAHTPHQIELGGLETSCIRMECDLEHPVWPSHGECNGGPFHVPFGSFQKLSAMGRMHSESHYLHHT